MCGLVGVIARKTFGFLKKDQDAFENLLYLDVLRGEDATGVITVEKDSTFHIDKESTPAYWFQLNYEKSKSRQLGLNFGHALLGHNRKATIGFGKDETAHPFVVKDRFAMVHNGTLMNHKKIADTVVDSEALAILVEQHINDPYGDTTLTDGAKLALALEEVNGAYACLAYNQVNHEVLVFRNKERPLYIGTSDDCYYIASEAWMIHAACWRNNIKLNGGIEPIANDCLYKFPMYGEGLREFSTEKYEVKKAPATPTPTVTSSTGVATSKQDTGTSKNRYKKFRKTALGSTIEFFPIDYQERYPDSAGASKNRDWVIMGECPKFENNNHLVRGFINLDTLGITQIDYVDHFLYRGKISMLEYNRKLKQMEITVKDVEKIPPVYKGKMNESSATVL